MNSGDKQRLQHIQTYCRDIAGFIQRFGKDYTTFITDRAYFNAVSMCVMQIGELANGLSEEYREETKDDMPWGMIRGMRNWLAHAYSDMDENVIWETANNDIPSLARFCERVLAEQHENTEQPPERERTMKERIADAGKIADERNAARGDHRQEKEKDRER